MGHGKEINNFRAELSAISRVQLRLDIIRKLRQFGTENPSTQIDTYEEAQRLREAQIEKAKASGRWR